MPRPPKCRRIGSLPGITYFPTFQRILSSARQKVADALLNGKALRTEGGNFELTHHRFRCQRGHGGKWTPLTAFRLHSAQHVALLALSWFYWRGLAGVLEVGRNIEGGGASPDEHH